MFSSRWPRLTYTVAILVSTFVLEEQYISSHLAFLYLLAISEPEILVLLTAFSASEPFLLKKEIPQRTTIATINRTI